MTKEIKLTEEQVERIKIYAERSAGYRLMLNEAMEKMVENERLMWRTFREMFPDMPRSPDIKYNHEDGILVIP